MTKEELKEKAHSLPLHPGVYIMMDASNTVIYVGRPRPCAIGSASIFWIWPATPKRPGPW